MNNESEKGSMLYWSTNSVMCAPRLHVCVCLLLSCILPGQSDAGSMLCSGCALNCPGYAGSSAGKACPLIPSPVLMVHPQGPGAAVRDRGWVSSKLQWRGWCKCEEIGCMDERTKKSKNWGYKKAKTGQGIAGGCWTGAFCNLMGVPQLNPSE